MRADRSDAAHGRGRSGGMIVMGLDPSLNGFGWCICDVSDAGVLTVTAGDVCRVPGWDRERRKKLDLSDADFFDLKLRKVAEQLHEAVAVWQPDLLVKEQQAGGSRRSAQAWKTVGAAHALAATAAMQADAEMVSVGAKEIKALMGATGLRPKESKKVVEREVRRMAPSAVLVLDGLTGGLRGHVADAIGAVLVAMDKGEVCGD